MKKIDFANEVLPNIMKNVSEKHSKFVLKFGDSPSLISVDHEAKLTRLKAKITAILKVFVDNDVISKYESVELDGFEYFILEKKNMFKKIHVVVGLECIIIADRSLYSIVGISTPIKKAFSLETPDRSIEDFDWEDFANNLLNEIHSTIYNSRESLDRIF